MLSPVLSRTLAAARPWFNERVAEARHRQPGFDVEALRGFVAGELDVLAQAVATVDPDRLGEAVQVGYEVGIELVGQRLLGPDARLPWVRRGWLSLVPRLPRLVALAPRDTLAALCNAAVQLATTPGVRMEQWIERLAAAAPACDSVGRLRQAGAVCAWRAGLVQMRQGALDAAAQLPPELVRACLDLAEGTDTHAALAGLRADRWFDVGAVQPAGCVLGGFTGFGGPFASPPQVRADASGFVLGAGDRAFAVDADLYGGAVLPATAARFDAARPAALALSRETREALAARLSVPDDDLLGAVHGPSLLVASPWSHRVLVVPRPS